MQKERLRVKLSMLKLLNKRKINNMNKIIMLLGVGFLLLGCASKDYQDSAEIKKVKQEFNEDVDVMTKELEEYPLELKKINK